MFLALWPITKLSEFWVWSHLVDMGQKLLLDYQGCVLKVCQCHHILKVT